MEENKYSQDRQTDRQTGRRPRNSSLELLRIIAMLVIITHHFGVHGVFHVLEPAKSIFHVDMFSWQVAFTQLIDWGGSMGNAIFILITGYFMVNRSVNGKKIVLLLLAMFFYAWLIEAVVYGGNFLPHTFKDIIHESLPILFGGNWFVSCYIIFSLFIPFENLFLSHLTKGQYQAFLALFFLCYSVLPTVKVVTFFSNAPILFFAFVYAIGGYLRLHGASLQAEGQHKRYLRYFFAMVLLLLASILAFDAVGLLLHKDVFLKGSAHLAMILNIPLAVSLFLYFLTRPYFFSAMINRIAGTVLGIYLIHDNNLMRTLIWDYIFPNLDYIHSSYYVLFYIGKVFAVFAICSIVELLRKRYVERPLSAALDRCWPSLRRAACAVRARRG